MGAIIVPRKWEHQPPHAAEIAPEYADAVTAFLGSGPAANLATGLPFTRRGSPLQSLSEFGEGSYSPAYASRHWREVRTFNPFAEDWPGVTVLVDITCANISNKYPGLSYCAPVGEYFGGWNLTAEDDGSGKKFVYWRAGNSGSGLTLSGSYGIAPGFSEWAPGDRLIMCGTYDVAAGKLRLVWSLDNGKANVVEVAHSPGWRNASSVENIGGYERYGYRSSPHPIRLVAVLPRALSANEQIALVENPWQIFKRQSLILPTEEGGSGAVIDLTGVGFSLLNSPVQSYWSSGIGNTNLNQSSSLISTSYSAQLEGVDNKFLSPFASTEIIGGLETAGFPVSISDTEISNIIQGLVELEVLGISFTPENVKASISGSLGVNSIDIDIPDIPPLTLKSNLLNCLFRIDIPQIETPFVLSLQDFSLNQAMWIKLESQGFSGSLNQKLLKYFQNQGATSFDLDDAERQWLESVTTPKECIEDMYRDYLGNMGYTGNINKIIKDFWVNL